MNELSTKATGRVIVLMEDTRYDVSGVEPYGQICYLFSRANRPPGYFRPDLVAKLDEALDDLDIDPETDTLALTGNTTLLSLLTALYAMKGGYRVLFFNAASDSYVLRELVWPA